MISLLQNQLVRTAAVRKKLGIPEFKRHAPPTETSKKGFVQAMREGMEYSILF